MFKHALGSSRQRLFEYTEPLSATERRTSFSHPPKNIHNLVRRHHNDHSACLSRTAGGHLRPVWGWSSPRQLFSDVPLLSSGRTSSRNWKTSPYTKRWRKRIAWRSAFAIVCRLVGSQRSSVCLRWHRLFDVVNSQSEIGCWQEIFQHYENMYRR